MSHDYHEGLPDYSPGQILHDGCGECEARAKSPDHGIGNLDRGNFARAWQRAAARYIDGLPDLSRAERPLLDILWAVQLKLETRGVPIGKVPTSDDDAPYFAGGMSRREERADRNDPPTTPTRDGL